MNQPITPHLLALTEGPNLALDKPIVLIGRHQECDIQIPSRKISRRHCCIAQVADHLVIRDLGSTNGVRINSVKVVEGNLQPNDEVMIGNMRYQVKWCNEPEQTAPANGMRAGHPKNGKASDDSHADPMALPDMSLSKPMPVGKPASNEPKKASPSLDVPDDVGLLPLDGPANQNYGPG